MPAGSQEQCQLVVPNDNSTVTCKSDDDDQYKQFLIEQSSQSSNHVMTTISSATSENENNNYSQQLRTTDVRINLIDCMKCYVKIPRCKIEQQIYDPNAHVQIKLDREIQEYREEQELASQTQDNQATSETVGEKEKEIEDENDGFIDYLDDYNPMNTFIIVDLPWPQAAE
ncbi:unnamed protein product [Rotaria sordida]|uniref:Uncharacterized protein n=1 Tax=Rotaria sordida TaxID=392033 RepID=A0A816DP22_9BILA|nr:unnamed protein product [Rotaria sordida]CAF1641284.1 unnamed protein product [Rotaria sordida]CAF4159449.1 unnamed protein product [Rotaria sordida]